MQGRGESCALWLLRNNDPDFSNRFKGREDSFHANPKSMALLRLRRHMPLATLTKRFTSFLGEHGESNGKSGENAP